MFELYKNAFLCFSLGYYSLLALERCGWFPDGCGEAHAGGDTLAGRATGGPQQTAGERRQLELLITSKASKKNYIFKVLMKQMRLCDLFLFSFDTKTFFMLNFNLNSAQSS